MPGHRLFKRETAYSSSLPDDERVFGHRTMAAGRRGRYSGSAGGDLAPYAGARSGLDAPVGGEPVDELQAPSRRARVIDAAQHGRRPVDAGRRPRSAGTAPAARSRRRSSRPPGDAVQEAVRDELGHEQPGGLDHRRRDAGLEPATALRASATTDGSHASRSRAHADAGPADASRSFAAASLPRPVMRTRSVTLPVPGRRAHPIRPGCRFHPGA